MLTRYLFQRIDNAQIIVFRVFLGLLLMAECWGAIATGWVKEVFVDPQFTFTFIGFEWTGFLLGKTMYYYYAVLGVLGLLVAIGMFYRASMTLFAIGWSLVYFMQKTHYNNHYYLLMLVCWIMVFIPAHRYLSIDVRMRPHIKSIHTYNWNRLLFIAQLLIVYEFAALAKLYPGWYSGQFLYLRFQESAIWFKEVLHWPSVSSLLQDKSFAQMLSWMGIGFDFLIIPLLLWRRTRMIAFIGAVIFHLFNSVTLQIGIFPYFALAMAIFCFPPEVVQRRFLPAKNRLQSGDNDVMANTDLPARRKIIAATFTLYILWQVYLPLRHWIIPGDVLWTEEGHRLAWRMMLRTKWSTIQFWVVDPANEERIGVRLSDYMTQEQVYSMQVAPDMMWQFAQYLKEVYRKKGRNISVYVNADIAVNGSEFYPYVDSKTDLAAERWNYFGHQRWILDPPQGFNR